MVAHQFSHYHRQPAGDADRWSQWRANERIWRGRRAKLRIRRGIRPARGGPQEWAGRVSECIIVEWVSERGPPRRRAWVSNRTQQEHQFLFLLLSTFALHEARASTSNTSTASSSSLLSSSQFLPLSPAVHVSHKLTSTYLVAHGHHLLSSKPDST